MLENDFSEKLGEMHVQCYPQLRSFYLRYSQDIGWLCTVQEYGLIVYSGIGNTWWEAMDKALYDLKEHGRKEKAGA